MRASRTFWELLSKQSVEIPLIQRDYAQGRDDRKTRQIREDFVKTLCTFVEDTDKRLDLDFVYGSSSSGKLVLLDGQQRLTTLFLLHWYVAIGSGQLTVDAKERLAHFTYETRTSSRDFCEALILNGLSEEQRNGESPVSGMIEDSPWFAMAWKKDPTVASMLVMLDEIDKVFKTKSDGDLWKKLTDEANPAITFYFLDMDTFKLTDELYIKMNSRGKPLSDFENFKAWLEKHVEVNGYNVHPGWEEKIDKAWTDLFWRHREKGSYEIDKPVLSFFKGMAMCQFAQSLPMASSKLENKSDDEWIKTFNADKFIATSDYEQLACFDETALNRIFDLLDFFAAYLQQEERRNEQLDELFAMFLVPKYVERVVSYAFAVLIDYFPPFISWDDRLYTNVLQWMRVMRNVIQNSRIDDPDAFVSAIQSIDNVASSILESVVGGEKTVYKAFAGMDRQDIGYFREIQVAEEIRKCQLLVNDPTWEELLRTYERHDYFYGQVGFLLDFAGEDLDQFERYASKAAKLFIPEILDSEEHKLERAFLSIGDYLIEVGQNFGFCLPKFGTSRLRDENWRSVFNDVDKSFHLKKLLDRVDVEQIEADLEGIIDEALQSDELEEWQRLFVECPKTIEVCGARQVRFENEDKNIYLLSKSRMSGYYAELRSFHFYWTYLKRCKEDALSPFNHTDYHWVNGREDVPCAYMDKWDYKGVDIALDISFDGEKYLLDVFGRDDKDVPKRLAELLENSGFCYSETEWPHKYVEPGILIQTLEGLLKQFRDLAKAEVNI